MNTTPATVEQIETAAQLGKDMNALAREPHELNNVQMYRNFWPRMIADTEVIAEIIPEMRQLRDAWLADRRREGAGTWEAEENTRDARERAQAEARQAERRRKRGDAPEGMHHLNGSIYKVQRAVHGSGHLYAKILLWNDDNSARFDYAPGMIRFLSKHTKMTLEEAKEWGALYGTCCVCGRTLTNEASIAEGLGPVCRKAWG